MRPGPATSSPPCCPSASGSWAPSTPDTLTTRDNLAFWTGEAGDAAGARDQLAALLPIRERVLGPEHPDTLITRHNLAHWTGQAGDAAGARDQLAALLPIRERVLGAEHPDTLTTRHNLAHWTGQAGDAAGARDQFAALLPIRERVLGPEHLQTLATRPELAYWTGKAEEAVSDGSSTRRLNRSPLAAECRETFTNRRTSNHMLERAISKGLTVHIRRSAQTSILQPSPSKKGP